MPSSRARRHRLPFYLGFDGTLDEKGGDGYVSSSTHDDGLEVGSAIVIVIYDIVVRPTAKPYVLTGHVVSPPSTSRENSCITPAPHAHSCNILHRNSSIYAARFSSARCRCDTWCRCIWICKLQVRRCDSRHLHHFQNIAHLNNIPEFRKQSTQWMNTVQDTATDVWDAAADSLKSVKSRVTEVKMPSLETPQFLKTLLSGSHRRHQNQHDHDKNSESDSQGQPPTPEEKTAIAALIAATLSSPSDPVQSERRNEARSDELMHLTRKLIEIRSILLSIDQNDALKLPSIVVIGSQSSGKSSVLETIVGHEFLPKWVYYSGLFLLYCEALLIWSPQGQ